MEMFKRQCERMWEHLEQRHKVQHDELNKECEPLRRLKPKFSPELLRMMVCPLPPLPPAPFPACTMCCPLSQRSSTLSPVPRSSKSGQCGFVQLGYRSSSPGP